MPLLRAATEIFQNENAWTMMEPAEGFEPPTSGLQNRCATTTLYRQIKNGGDYIISVEMTQIMTLPFLHDL